MKNRYDKPQIIAEVGCNHKGEFETALEFIQIAALKCGVSAVKFQKRCIRECLSIEQYNAPHPNPQNAYGKTYGEHREFLEFTIEQHKLLKLRCEELNVVYSSSVWDLTSAKEIASLKPLFIKIPSACNNNYEMLEWLCNHYVGELHISLGMTKKDEEKALVRFFIDKGRNDDLVLYTCTSGYPVVADDVCLLEINRLILEYGSVVKRIGFSGHHNGFSIDIAAYTLGAVVIERHFTLDRCWKGTDHAASLEPDDLKSLISELNIVGRALTYKSQDILPVEAIQREKLKYKGINIIGYDLLKIKMFLTDCDGVLTDGGMYYSGQGEELKKFNTRDGAALRMLHEKGIITGIITGESSLHAIKRGEKIQVDEIITGVEDKLSIVNKLCVKYNIDVSNVLYIGDDLNDLDVIKHVGFGVCVNDGNDVVKSAAKYITKLSGGNGAVREAAELILQMLDVK